MTGRTFVGKVVQKQLVSETERDFSDPMHPHLMSSNKHRVMETTKHNRYNGTQRTRDSGRCHNTGLDIVAPTPGSTVEKL
jgi:hypothetical protein